MIDIIDDFINDIRLLISGSKVRILVRPPIKSKTYVYATTFSGTVQAQKSLGVIGIFGTFDCRTASSCDGLRRAVLCEIATSRALARCGVAGGAIEKKVGRVLETAPVPGTTPTEIGGINVVEGVMRTAQIFLCTRS
jgi:hypothetical protein